MDLNRVILSGTAVGDSVVTEAPGESPVCEFRLCINTPRHNAGTGKWETNLTFINCVVFGHAARVAGRQIKRGRHVSLEGRLCNSWWERAGEKRFRTQVNVETFDVFGRETTVETSPVHYEVAAS